MALVPTTAKIAELRLGVSAPTASGLRPLTRRETPGPMYREHWRGEVLFAPMAAADAAEVVAFFEGLDGRVAPFEIDLSAFSASHDVAAATLTSIVSSRLLTLSKATATQILPGTLLGIGSTSGDYQLVEVIAPGVGGTTQTVEIAPRLRYAFAASTPIAIAVVQGRFALASDTLDFLRGVPASGLTISILEA